MKIPHKFTDEDMQNIKNYYIDMLKVIERL